MTFIYLIIIAIIASIIYVAVKGNADLKNVEKYGGLKIKYKTLIDAITARNPYYQMVEKNQNFLELINTGIKFRLIELDKKLQVVWVWNSFSSGTAHKLIWKFGENEDQLKMYERIDKDITIQNLIDDGMSRQQAEDFYIIGKTQNTAEKERLLSNFSKKNPELWSKITGK